MMGYLRLAPLTACIAACGAHPAAVDDPSLLASLQKMGVTTTTNAASGSTTSLLPQEPILEYLMLQVGTCVGPPPPN